MKIYVDYGIMNFGHAPLRLEIYLSKEEWRSVHSIPHIHGDVFLADIRGNQIKELEIPDDFISLYGWRRWGSLVRSSLPTSQMEWQIEGGTTG